MANAIATVIPANQSRSRPMVAPKIVTGLAGKMSGVVRVAVPKLSTAIACKVNIKPMEATTLASVGAVRRREKISHCRRAPSPAP